MTSTARERMLDVYAIGGVKNQGCRKPTFPMTLCNFLGQSGGTSCFCETARLDVTCTISLRTIVTVVTRSCIIGYVPADVAKLSAASTSQLLRLTWTEVPGKQLRAIYLPTQQVREYALKHSSRRCASVVSYHPGHLRRGQAPSLPST